MRQLNAFIFPRLSPMCKIKLVLAGANYRFSVQLILHYLTRLTPTASPCLPHFAYALLYLVGASCCCCENATCLHKRTHPSYTRSCSPRWACRSLRPTPESPSRLARGWPRPSATARVRSCSPATCRRAVWTTPTCRWSSRWARERGIFVGCGVWLVVAVFSVVDDDTGVTISTAAQACCRLRV